MTATVPAVELFTTSILSNHKVRHRHERYVAVFTAKKVDYIYHDLASDEDAKKRFRRKALDPQIPNILVHNEWRGTFEEFEEAIEFGELELFLKVDLRASAAPESVVPADGSLEPGDESVADISIASSHKPSQKLPPAPTAAPRMAPEGSGAGPQRNSMDDFLDSLSAWKPQVESLSESDLSALLDEGESSHAKKAHEEVPKAPKDLRVYPGQAASGAPVEVKRTYFPSEGAGTHPLRLPKMGNGSRTVSSPIVRLSPGLFSSASSDVSPRRSPAQHARFSVSQNSSRALAAEATASSSSRIFSARQIRSGLDSGKKLQQILGEVQSSARENRRQGLSEEADHLLEELGLSDLKLSDEEAEAFLLTGQVPEGLQLGGSRLQRGGTLARKAREQEAARDVAERARNLASERRESASVAKERRERVVSGQAEADQKPGPDQAMADQEPVAASLGTAPAPPVMSTRTKEVLERAKEKRASRQVQLPAGDAVLVKQEFQEVANLTDVQVRALSDEISRRDPDTIQKATTGPEASPRQLSLADDQTNKSAQGSSADTRPASSLSADRASEFAAGLPVKQEDLPIAAPNAEEVVMERTSADLPENKENMVTESKDVPSLEAPALPNSGDSISQPPSEAATLTNEEPEKSDKKAPTAVAVVSDSEKTRAVTPSTDEEEIDELLARLSGLGSHQLSEIAKPLPNSDEQTSKAGLRQLDEVKEEPEEFGEQDVVLEQEVVSDRKRVSQPGAAISSPQGTIPSPSLLSPPRDTSSDTGGRFAKANAGAVTFCNGMKRSESNTSSSSAASVKQLQGFASPVSTPGARKAMEIRRKSSVTALSLSPPLSALSGSAALGSSIDGGRGRSSGNMTTSDNFLGSTSPVSAAVSSRSPRLKTRLQKSFGSMGRKSNSSSSHGSVSSPPLTATAIAHGGSEWRSERTLSQILRDADEAMADGDDRSDEDKGEDDGPSELLPDDGPGGVEMHI